MPQVIMPSPRGRLVLPTGGLELGDVGAALAAPDDAAWECDVGDAEDDLIDFIRMCWHVVEPAREFVRNWVMDAIADHLMAVTRGDIRKLLINVPPGFMKSLMTNVFWPAWEWGPRNHPSYRYVAASYSQDLTIRDNLRTRLIMKSPQYQRAWGERFAFSTEQDAKVKFANDKTGFKIATSVQGLGTGERGDRVIVDDPHNVLEAESDAKRNTALQWFTEVMPSRVNDPKRATFVVIMQRVHEQDVSGLILEKELGYTHLCVPMHYDSDHPWAGKKAQVSVIDFVDPRQRQVEAIKAYEAEHGETVWTKIAGHLAALAFPERYDQASVDEMTKAMMAWGGRYAVEGQLQQRPTPRGGGMLLREWFEIVDRVPIGYATRCRGWDFAATEDGDGAGSAAVKIAEVWAGQDRVDPDHPDSDLYVEDCVWERVSPGGLYQLIMQIVKSDGYEVFQSFPQDPAQAGKYQMADLLPLVRGYDHEFTPESGEKEIRMRPFAAQAETRALIGRRIKLVRGPWNEVFLDHVCKFPRGRYKDVPDATSRSYGSLVKRGGGMFLIGGSVLITADAEAQQEYA